MASELQPGSMTAAEIQKALKQERFGGFKSSDFLKHVDRTTINWQIHHQRRGGEPVGHPGSTWFFNETQGQRPYVREILVPPERDWMTLSFDWLSEVSPPNVGLLVLENRTGLISPINLSEAEEKELDGRVVEMNLNGGEGPSILLKRGQAPFIGCLENVESLRIRCVTGVAEVLMTAFPR
jgi:hypothetical protein